MSRLKLFGTAIGLAWAVSLAAFGSPTGKSIAINFGADEPVLDPPGVGSAVTGAAGLAATVNWNNTELATGIAEDLTMDVNGVATPTTASVEWLSAGTWASEGRGEDINDAPQANDRFLMTGYLDTTDVSITEVTVDGLPADIAGGFDLFVYILGGVTGRGGTYTVTADGPSVSKDNVITQRFDGTYIEGAEGNYLLFPGLTGNSFTLEAQATTTALFRAAVNGIEICAVGQCIPKPTPVAGRNVIGDQTLPTTAENGVFGPPEPLAPGLMQEWYGTTNPGNKDGVDAIFDTGAPIVSPFQADNGSSWWSGNTAPISNLVQYPAEVQPPFNATGNDNYVVRSTGEILIPESGTYRFADGVDDYTYLAIDLDKSGVAGDDPVEVLINDNTWTDPIRSQNGGGGGFAEVDITVAAGGQWLAMEFNMGEGGGGDSGVIYWDYNPSAPAGQRLGGGEGFPDDTAMAIDAIDAESLWVPDTHLRSSITPLVSADLVASIEDSPLGFEFELNGDTGEADTFVLTNPNPSIYTTVLNVDGVNFLITATGSLEQGEAFKIIDANEIVGTPVILSSGAGQTWTFNSSTGQIIFGAAGILGDYNKNGALDAADLDLQANAITGQQNPKEFDLNSDNLVNYDDRVKWLHDLKKTWVGDSNLDGQFKSDDFVLAFQAGKYETANQATWVEGDWDGNKLFQSGDFVAAFADGGYEAGVRPGSVSAVPEPGSIVLALLGLTGLWGFARRRQD